MHTTPVLNANQLAAYHSHLQTDHDFAVWVDILTMEETFVGTAELLDGQVNFSAGNDGPETTASITLSDPEGALSFGMRYASDSSNVLWVNRLLRVRHRVVVPTIGPVTCTAIVGVPTSVSRHGAELGIELGDKSLLADHGVRARTYKKGMRVDLAIRSILRDLTGEHHLRIPPTKKKLSKPYTVGMGEDETTPWKVAKRIAGREKGWRLFYSADGYATAEPTAVRKTTVPVESLLALPESSTSFTDFINYTHVTSNRKPKNKKKPVDKSKKNDKKKKAKEPPDITIRFEGTAVLAAGHDLSEQSLSRHGVPRTLPLVVDDDDLRTQKEVNDRARQELAGGSGLDSEQTFEIMPLFHLDKGDKITLPLGVGTIGFNEASIPLGTGGNMSIGAVKWVSRPVRVRRVRSKRTVLRKRKKGGKKHGH